MKQSSVGIVLVALSLLIVVASVDATEERTLTGLFNSGYQDGDDPVRAVFTPVGDGLWNVNFYFKFNGADHAYGGTAEGSLDEGALEGEVVNESKRRTFTFQGEFERGDFAGRHAEIGRDGKEHQTGSITLGE